ncbi:MAG: HAD family hydrolase [Clostridiales bacterium]|nr:HAD family hydrolase [Clostridiales bacterium]
MDFSRKKFALFDLDGTLTDPGEGITKGVSYALESFGIETPDLTQLYKFIGPPLLDSFIEYYGFSLEDAKIAISKYREYYREKGIYENEVLPGVEKMLATLEGNGMTLILATSKPAHFAQKVLAHFGLSKYFAFVSGSEMDGSRTKKSEVITHALDNVPGISAIESIMIGDRLHDIIGAKETGMDSIGVLFGYGSLKELTDAGANFIASSPDEVCSILLG